MATLSNSHPRTAEIPDSLNSEVFISYSRRDEVFIRRLVDALEARGYRCWVDWQDIRPSAEWMAEVEAAIDATSAFVFVISPNSVRSRVCLDELRFAADANKRILPIVASDPSQAEVPQAAHQRNWIFFRSQDDFDTSLKLLTQAIDTDPEWAAMHTRLLVRAREWEREGRDRSYLLRGRDLRAAEGWLSSADMRKDPQPTAVHTEYVISSRRAAARGQRLRMAALGVGLVVASGLAILALVQRNRAEDEALVARSGELAATSLLTAETKPDDALAIAVEAARVAPTPQAEQALRRGLEQTSALIGVLRGHEGKINQVAVSPARRLIASAGEDGLVVLWSPDGTKRTELRSGTEPVKALSFSPDGDHLGLALGKYGIEVWDVSSRELERRFKVSDAVSSIALGLGGRMVVGGGPRGAEIWKPRGGESSRQLDETNILGVALSPRGDRVLTAAAGGLATVWATASGRRVARLDVAAEAGLRGVDVNAATFDASGSRAITASADGVARVWNLNSNAVTTSIQASRDELTTALLDRRGSTMITAGFDNEARVWDPAAGGKDPRTGLTRGLLLETLKGHDGVIYGAGLSPNGALAATGSADGTIRSWDTDPDDSSKLYEGHSNQVKHIAFSADGNRLITAGVDSQIRIWNRAGKTLTTLRAPNAQAFLDAELSPAGELVVTSGLYGGIAALWDVDSERQIASFATPNGFPSGAQFTPDGESIVIVNDLRNGKGSVQVRGVPEGTLEQTIHAPTGLLSLDVSPDSKVVAAGGEDGSVTLWDIDSAEVVAVLEGHTDFVRSVRFDASGALLVSASEDRTATVWDLTTNRAVSTLVGHSGGVQGADFSPGGTLVVTGATDRSVRVWETESGELLDVLEGYGDWVYSVDFSPDGDSIAASGAEPTARIFTCELCIPFDDLLAKAEERVAATLTPKQVAALPIE